MAHANRGNVAIIVWNTLEAPYVWDVMGTEFEGTINLQNSQRSLLSIYFRDFSYDVDGDSKTEYRKLKEVETTVESTPARNSEIGDRQIVLPAIKENFDFKTTFKKKDVKEECTYAKLNTKDEISEIVAYVPENVFEDLDSLKGKTVTVIFGKDNTVALITVEDDLVENEYLTKYVSADRKITVGDKVYKLAKSYDVVLNDEEYDTLSDALTALKVEDEEDIEKNIEATLTLDIDDKVEKIDLFASANIAKVSTEALVIKVKESSKKYKLETTKGNIEWTIDDEDDINFPRVYVDGKKADIKDIQVGNVLTIIGENLDIEDINTIYVSTKTVTGEATKIKKANNAITIEGEVYVPSEEVYDGNNYAKIMTEEELKENDWVAFDSSTILDNDEVVLYINVLGEYVAVSVADDTSDYQFGVVTYISENITWEGDDDEIAVRNIKVLLPDGTKKTFKVKADTNDDDIPATVYNKVVTNGTLGVAEGDFVSFEANADSVITLEDGDEIQKLLAGDTVDKYKAVAIKNTAVDGKTFNIDGGDTKTYSYTSKTVIFNSHAATQNPVTEEKREIVKDWDSIIDANDKVPAGAYAIFDKDSTKALYIVVDMPDYTSSDAEYAIVASKLVEVKDGKYEIDFVGNVDMKVKSELPDLKNAINWLVRYTTSSGKVNTANKLVDLDAFEDDLDDTDLVTDSEVKSATGKLELAYALAGVTKKHLKVNEVTLEKDYASVEYIDEVENDDDVFARGTYYTKSEEDKYVKAKSFDSNEATNEGYYVKNGEEYVKPDTQPTDANFSDKTYFTKSKEEVYTLAKSYSESETYYEKDGNTYKQATIKNSAKDSLGLIRLDEDNLVVLDLRYGAVKEISLDKVEKDSYVVIYKENGVCSQKYDGNVVFVIE